jgi:predicted acetyltransferase
VTDRIAGLEVRPVTDSAEFAAYYRACELAFGVAVPDDEIPLFEAMRELDRLWSVHDSGRIVATSGIISLALTTPGSSVRMGGITDVGVLATHRRRGLLTGLMQRMLADCAERGEPLAGLWASESIIYGRFGFGCAADQVRLQIETARSAFRQPVDVTGRVRMLDPSEAMTLLPGILDRARMAVPGGLDRPHGVWSAWLEHDPEGWRDGAGPRQVVAVDDLGYAIFRVAEHWTPTAPRHTLKLLDLQAVDDETAAVLWRYVLDVDLVAEVDAWYRPVDDPVLHRLADPRRAGRTTIDALWLRILDVPAALEARRYRADGRLVLGLDDDVWPDAAGRYALEIADGRAEVTTTSAEPDLVLGPEELGALYLGGMSASGLAAAGRITAIDTQALQRADLLLGWHRAPWCPVEF